MTTNGSNATTGSTERTDEVQMALNLVYQQGLERNPGALADYIPELARVDPDRVAWH